MCEALIALFEATGDAAYLERATTVARKLTVELPAVAGCTGRVCEHYTTDWVADPDKNKVGGEPENQRRRAGLWR